MASFSSFNDKPHTPLMTTTTAVASFHSNQFERPLHLPESLFAKSKQLTVEGIQRNQYNHNESTESSPLVKLINLKKTSMNGQIGRRGKWYEHKGRYKVVFNTTAESVNSCRENSIGSVPAAVLIKPANLKVIKCLHENVQPWEVGWNPINGWISRKKWICDDCKKDLTKERWGDERKHFEKVRKEDNTKSAEEHATFLHSKGIRIDALIAFANDHDCWEWPTWKVNRDIIKPATRQTRCRYGELLETKEYFGPATVFVSHCWGASFGDLIGAACHGARKDRFVWIDIFAVRQWPGNVADLDFRCVIEKCKALIVSVSPVDGLKPWLSNKLKQETFLSSPDGQNAKKSNPFFRLWCVVEIAAAISMSIPVIVKGGRLMKNSNGTYYYNTKCLGDLFRNLQYMIDTESCKCAIQADYDREMAVVQSLNGGRGVAYVNNIVKGLVVGAIASLEFDVLEIDAAVCGEPEALSSMKFTVNATRKDNELAGKVLLAAAAGGRVQIVKEFLKQWQGIPGFCEFINNLKVVWNASSGGHAKIVELLLGVEKVDANVSLDMNRSTALSQACANGHLKVVNILLGAPGIDVNREKTDGRSPLWQACDAGHIEVVIRLLDVPGIDVNRPQITTQASPLWMACQYGYFEVVEQLLLVEGINVNHPTDKGITPFSVACSNGHVKVMERLLSIKSVDVHRTSKSGSSPLFFACQNGYLEVVKRLLCVNGVDINQQNYSGLTALIIASHEGHTNIVRILLRQLNIHLNKEALGRTALNWATHNKHYDVVSLLKNVGALLVRPSWCREETREATKYATKQKCLQGHPLVFFTVPKSGFRCDICVKHQATSSIMYGCDGCNYDICESCSSCSDGEHCQVEMYQRDQAIKESGETKVSSQSSEEDIDQTKKSRQTKDSFYGSELSYPGHIEPSVFLHIIKQRDFRKQRNPFNYYTKESPKWKPCIHEVVKGFPGSNKKGYRTCADCGAELDLKRAESEAKWAHEAQKEDAKLAATKVEHGERLRRCGVRVDWLVAFTFALDCWDWPTWKVNRHIIKPSTWKTRCRFAHLPFMKNSSFSGAATVFISHCWGAKWGTVVLAACQGASLNRYVWIDIFAVRQWPGREADIDFRNVLRGCIALVAAVSTVHDLTTIEPWWGRWEQFLASSAGEKVKKRLTTSRLWCMVEISAAVSLGKNIIVKAGEHREVANGNAVTYTFETSGVDIMLNHLAKMTKVERADCSYSEDYDRELKKISNQKGGIPLVNQQISGVMCGLAVKHRIVEIDSAACGEFELLRKLNIGGIDTAKQVDHAKRVFMAAVSTGNVNIVRELIQHLLCPVVVVAFSQEAMWGAANRGHTMVLNVLINEAIARDQLGRDIGDRVDINQPCSSMNKSTSLWIACQNGHDECVRFLLGINGIDVNRADNRGISPLHTAASNGHANIVKMLLVFDESIGTVEVNRSCSFGTTPLFIASINNHAEVVELLLKHPKVIVSKCAHDGVTPFQAVEKHLGKDSKIAVLLKSAMQRPRNRKKW
jgi:ankyrin repeat protein